MSEEYVKCLEIGPRCAVEDSIYGYTPNRAVNGLLCVLFGICCLIQLFQAWKYKTWTYSIAMVLGCLSECIGKLVSPQKVLDQNTNRCSTIV